MKAFLNRYTNIFFWLIAIALPAVVLLRSRGLAVIFPFLGLGIIASAIIQVGFEKSWRQWSAAARQPWFLLWIFLFVWMGVQCLWALNPSKAFGTLTGVAIPCVIGALTLWAVPRVPQNLRGSLTGSFILGGGLVFALLGFEVASNGGLVQMTLGRALANYAKGFSFFNVLFWPWIGLVFYKISLRFARPATYIICAALIGVMGLLAFNLTTSAVVVQWICGVLAFGLTLKWPRFFWVIWGGLLAMLFLEPWIILKTCTLEMQAKYLVHLKGSAQHRIEIWYYLSQLLGHFPWGVGMDGVRFLKDAGIPDPDFIHYASPTFRHVSSHYGLLVMHPHNLPLQIWAELGIPGTFTFVAVVMGALAKAWGNLSPAWKLGRAIFSATLASAMIPALLSYGAWQSWWIASLWLATITFAWLAYLFNPSSQGIQT